MNPLIIKDTLSLLPVSIQHDPLWCFLWLSSSEAVDNYMFHLRNHTLPPARLLQHKWWNCWNTYYLQHMAWIHRNLSKLSKNEQNVNKNVTLTLLDRDKDQNPQCELHIHDQTVYRRGLCLWVTKNTAGVFVSRVRIYLMTDYPLTQQQIEQIKGLSNLNSYFHFCLSSAVLYFFVFWATTELFE